MSSKQDSHNRSFNIGLAKKYGVNGAILLFDIIYWLQHNKDENINYFGGRTWTHRTYNGFKKHFPFWTRRQIENSIKKLKDAGVLISAPMDPSDNSKGNWYGLVNEDEFLHGSYPQDEEKKEEDPTQNCATPTQNCAGTLIYKYNKQENKKGFSKKRTVQKKSGDEKMGIKYASDSTDYCKFVDQSKNFGDQDYMCKNPATQKVMVENMDGKKFDFDCCPRHEKLISNRNDFKYFNTVYKVLGKDKCQKAT